ncbi:hypothetical protein [Dyadobacter diqingensis]|uniref:hypothetical protein n=1 Tax=Dyadobacter diqingensis TaxID=2938121 RepID=UPI0020C1B927|nr:hypothetical protein [Dyadobacter diqingensis]
MEAIKISFSVLIAALLFSCNEEDSDVMIFDDVAEISYQDRKPFEYIAPVLIGTDHVEKNKPFRLQITSCDYEGVSISPSQSAIGYKTIHVKD